MSRRVDAGMIFLHENFHRARVTPEQMDALWAAGWRHFGTEFFRYSVALHRGYKYVTPLRVELAKFTPSRSQRRVAAKNRDLRVVIRASFIDAEKEAMFDRHKLRFAENTPDSIHGFLSSRPASVPCTNREIAVYAGERLIAVTFLDIGHEATSGVYAIFEPDEGRRSLGVFSILECIRYSRELGYKYYYPGYAYREPSVYDYKKRFAGLEYLAWGEGWKPFPTAENS